MKQLNTQNLNLKDSFILKLLIVFASHFIFLSHSLQDNHYHSCSHDNTDYTSIYPTNDFFTSYSTKYSSQKFSSFKAKSMRITYEKQDIPSEISGIPSDYIVSLLDSLTIYMRYLVKVVPRQNPIKNVSQRSTCLGYSYPTYFQATGVSNSDYHIFISYINTDTGNSSPFAGYWCEVDPNPVAAVIEINYAKIAHNFPSSSGYSINFKSLLHAFMHLLGFSYSLLPYWIDYSQQQPYGASLGKILSQNNSFGSNSVTQGLTSYNVKYYANQYYKCATVTGMLLENQPKTSTSNSHWEFDLTGNDLMVENTYIYNLISLSEFTLSLLRDTGFYDSINSNMIAQSLWGKGEYCDFVQANCRSATAYIEFNANTDLQCDFFSLGFAQPIVPSPNSECSMVQLDNTNLCENDVDNPPNEIARMNTGVSSRCFRSNAYQTSGGTQTTKVKCHKALCNSDSSQILVTIWGSETVTCTFQNQVISLSSNGKGTSGNIICPSNFKIFCGFTTQQCLNNCSNHGFCNKGICYCSPGFAGDDCSIQCPSSNQVLENSSCSVTCGSGNFRTPSNTCSNSCPTGFYGDAGTQTCELCHPFCSLCTGPSAVECQECNFPYLYTSASTKCSDKKCNASCQTCFGSAVNNCIKCWSGYYLDSSNTCSKCDANCKECEGSSKTCMTCPDTANYFYILDSSTNTCVSSCDSTCLTCSAPSSSTSCLSCSDGYFLKLGQCLQCASPCKTCITSKSLCQTCESGYSYQSPYLCNPICDSSCKSCIKPGITGCLSCFDGNFYQAGSCLKCDSPCKTCVGMKSACQSCIDGYTYKSDKLTCIINCDSSCLTCSAPNSANSCLSCQSGYYLTNLNTCAKCKAPCNECTSTESKCTSCITGYKFVAPLSTCSIICDQACQTCLSPLDSSRCILCASGYITIDLYSPLTCFKCTSNCVQCQSSSSCQVCQSGYKLVGGSCEIECDQTCKTCTSPQSDTSCSSCNDGYFLSANQCIKCSDSCQTCTNNSTNCISCSPNFVKVGNLCTLNCDQSCETCSISNDENSCLTCRDGYFLEQSILSSNIGKCSLCSPYCFKCQQQLINGTFIMQCLQCQIGYQSDSQGNCGICDSSCETCSQINDPGSCLTCYPDYNLTELNECIKCEQGQNYSPTLKNCINCPENCKICSEESKCSSCFEGFQLNENKLCSKINDCHYSCGICTDSSYSSCITCSGNRDIIIINSQQNTGLCNCPSEMTDNGVAQCEDSGFQQIIEQTSKISFALSMSTLSFISLINLNPIPFFMMMEFCQSTSYLTYINYKTPLGLDEVLNTISYVNLSKFQLFKGYFSSSKDNKDQNQEYNQQRFLDEIQQTQANIPQSDEYNDNIKFKLNDLTNSFLENSILIIGINVIAWLISGIFYLIKISEKNSLLQQIKRIFCISAPIAVFVLSSQEFSLLIFLQILSPNFSNVLGIINFSLSLAGLVYILGVLIYLTYQLKPNNGNKYTFKAEFQKPYQSEINSNKFKIMDFPLSQKNSRLELSNYWQSRQDLSIQKITQKTSQQSQIEMTRNQTILPETSSEKSNFFGEKTMNFEQQTCNKLKILPKESNLYFILKYVKQDNFMSRNLIQIMVFRKLLISLSCAVVSVYPIAQIGLQICGYIFYSLYLFLTKPLKKTSQMLVACVIDSIITILHILYLVMMAYVHNETIQKLMPTIILSMTITVFIIYFFYSIFILAKLIFRRISKCIYNYSQIRMKKLQLRSRSQLSQFKQNADNDVPINRFDPPDQQKKSLNFLVAFSTSKIISPQISPREVDKQ